MSACKSWCSSWKSSFGRRSRHAPSANHLLRWRLQALEPTGCFKRFHRIAQLDYELVDQITSGTLECPDVKSRGSGCDTCQHQGCLSFRATWSLNAHEASPFDQAGAQHSQSPKCRYGAVMGHRPTSASQGTDQYSSPPENVNR